MNPKLKVIQNIFISLFPNNAGAKVKRNAYYSKAFIKIKDNIEKSENTSHLVSCRHMIENADPILTTKEVRLLTEFLLERWDIILPTGESFADEMDSVMHKRLSEN